MSSWLTILGAIGVICALLGLVGVGMSAAVARHYGIAATCLCAFAAILFLLLAGIEYAGDFWEGR